jgi:hypothetical protein
VSSSTDHANEACPCGCHRAPAALISGLTEPGSCAAPPLICVSCTMLCACDHQTQDQLYDWRAACLTSWLHIYAMRTALPASLSPPCAWLAADLAPQEAGGRPRQPARRSRGAIQVGCLDSAGYGMGQQHSRAQHASQVLPGSCAASMMDVCGFKPKLCLLQHLCCVRAIV